MPFEACKGLMGGKQRGGSSRAKQKCGVEDVCFEEEREIREGRVMCVGREAVRIPEAR